MNQLCSCTPLSLEGKEIIQHIAFNGCSYYCTLDDKSEILELDPSLEMKCRYYTSREYDNICYDSNENCFWVSAKKCNNKIFQLDCCMKEIGSFDICNTCIYGFVTGISYDCCNDTILISYPCMIIGLEKTSGKTDEIYKIKKGEIKGVLSLYPRILMIVPKDQKQYIEIFDPSRKKVESYCITGQSAMKNIIFNPCKPDCSHPIELFTLTKDCRPYLCKWETTFDKLDFVPDKCNNKCIECHREDKPKDPCTKIIESIAHIEAAIAHILNAEGEKLRKVLEKTIDVEEILHVNREVNKTIIHVTHLEQVLYTELLSILDGDYCDCEESDVKENDSGSKGFSLQSDFIIKFLEEKTQLLLSKDHDD